MVAGGLGAAGASAGGSTLAAGASALAAIVVPAVAGVVLGGGAMVGLINSQTSPPAPADNPAATQEILTYGDR